MESLPPNNNTESTNEASVDAIDKLNELKASLIANSTTLEPLKASQATTDLNNGH